MTKTSTLKGEEEIANVILDARAAGNRLRIQGGATRGADNIQADQILDASNNEGVVIYEPGSLHMVAKAGTKISAVQKLLDQENQMLAFEPMDHRRLLGTKGEPTLGGMVSGNVSGPRRFLSGACRDHLLGVRFVNGEGKIIKSGGRVMKNVTGLDLAKLQCGAHGTLGVLTEVSLKTLPKPEMGETLSFANLDAEKAVEVFCTALQSPYEVSGVAWVDRSAYLRLEGLEIQINGRTDKLIAELAQTGVERIKGKAHDALWAQIRDVQHFAEKPGSVWRVSVKPTDAPGVAQELQRTLDAEIAFDWGGGLIWALVPENHEDPADDIRRIVDERGGHSTLVRGASQSRQNGKAFQPEPPRLAALSKQLQNRFDPDGIFNPEFMVQGI